MVSSWLKTHHKASKLLETTGTCKLFVKFQPRLTKHHDPRTSWSQCLVTSSLDDSLKTGSWTPELGPTAAKSLWRAFMFSSIVFPCQLCHIEDGQRNTKMQLYRKSFLQSHCGLTFCTLYQWWKLLSTAGWRSSDRWDVLSLFVLVNSGSLVALFFSGLMWISYLPSNFNSSCFFKDCAGC